ncbi:MAG: lipopolysaccharide biosynthesis protein [Victivallales bacterium]|nr:lipopolysaccharide biosynthesis protein [Victivallales bacterium]
MDNQQLKKKAATGFAYRFAERALAKTISFGIQLLLARLLLPEQYGLIALVAIVITICDVFVTYGFGNALIVNKDSDQLDFSTCFYFCVVLAIVLYTSLFFASPLIATFYKNEELTPILRVMGLRIPLAAVNSVQHAYVSKHLRFKKFFYATLIGTLVSGVGAVVMAYMGFGVWALVEQYLGHALIGTLCLWIIVGWRPTWQFSFSRLKAIYSYGWKILAIGLIDTVFSRLRSLVIGRKYSSADLAFYTRGYSFPSFGMRMIEPTVNSVLFPTLSKCNDNQSQMRAITRRVLQVSTYIISPIMVVLIVMAKPLVLFLLTEKWLPCVVFLQIGCTANLFRCQQFINNCVIKSSGQAGLLLKLDILKKCIGLVYLLTSMYFGVIWIAWSMVAFYFTSMVINIAPNRKILDYGYWQQFKDVAENMVPAFIMGACVYPLSLLHLHNIVLLVLQSIAGAVIYVGISVVMKNESFHFVLRFVGKKVLKKKKPHKPTEQKSE